MVDGFFRVDVAPFPKSQNQMVGFPDDESKKLTTSGEQPEAVAAVKLATGACARAMKQSSTQNSVRMVSLRINFLKLNVRFGKRV